MKWPASVLLALSCAGSSLEADSSPMDASTAASLPSLGLNSSWVTVSGLSSGGYFAVQMHVAYSKTFSGVGVFAGGPFFCAGLPPTSVGVAQTACMVSPSLINVDALVLVAHNTAATGTIDPLSNLQDDRVYVFSGTEDSVVHTGVVQKLAHYYGEFVTTPNRIKQEYDIAAEHCMPTVGYGNACDYLGEPYINNCGYDAVGPMLQHIYDDTLSAPSKATLNTTGTGDYVEFSQVEFLDPVWTLSTASMYKTGVVYVPKACSAEESVKRSASGKAPCRLHVAFHGCKQTIPMIGSQFYEHSGYAAWADENDIVVLFPQAIKNTANPNGCWDWWGYTGMDYASDLGEQMRMSKKMVDRILAAPKQAQQDQQSVKKTVVLSN